MNWKVFQRKMSRIKNRRKKDENIEERVQGKEDACNWNSKRRRERRQSKSNMRLSYNRGKTSTHRFKKPYKAQVGYIK